MMMTSREVSRYGASIRVLVWNWYFGAQPGCIKNLRDSGAFIQMEDTVLPQGAQVSINFVHLGSTYRISGEVVHVRDDGIGIVFYLDKPRFPVHLGMETYPGMVLEAG